MFATAEVALPPAPGTSLRAYRTLVRRKMTVVFSSLKIFDSSTKAEATKCWAEFKTTKETAETCLKAVCRRQYIDYLWAGCLHSISVCYIFVAGIQCLEMTRNRTKIQASTSKSHGEFAKCSPQRVVDCTSRQSRGIICMAKCQHTQSSSRGAVGHPQPFLWWERGSSKIQNTNRPHPDLHLTGAVCVFIGFANPHPLWEWSAWNLLLPQVLPSL